MPASTEGEIMTRPTGEVELSLIKKFKSCRLTTYRVVPTETCWSIDWGHYRSHVEAGRTIRGCNRSDGNAKREATEKRGNLCEILINPLRRQSFTFGKSPGHKKGHALRVLFMTA